MPTFLHTADIHLDSAFSAHFDAKHAEMRRREVLRCLSGIIERAKEVDLLLISGDLFDSKTPSAETVSFLKRKFAELGKTRVFIAAGNHDPYSAGSVYAKEDFGSNVHVFATYPECIEIPELSTRVFGASFGDAFCDDTIEFSPIEKEDGIADIMVLHGDLTSVGGNSRYNPIDKSFIENCGADYLALGHIHKRSEVLRVKSTYYAYPGVPEGRGFDECGDMGCYIGNISNGAVNAEFERTCIRRMYRTEVDISGVTDNLGAAEVVTREIEKLGSPEDMYRIILTGRTARGFLNPDIIKEELSSRVYHLEIRDETRGDYDIEQIAAQNTLCGEFVRIMQRKMQESGADSDVLHKAMALGIDTLLGGDR